MTIFQPAHRETGIFSKSATWKPWLWQKSLKFKTSVSETSPFKGVYVSAHTWTGMAQLY